MQVPDFSILRASSTQRRVAVGGTDTAFRKGHKPASALPGQIHGSAREHVRVHKFGKVRGAIKW